MRAIKIRISLTLLGVALLMVLAATAQAVTAQAQDTGILEGQVENGTADGPLIGEGIAVTLHVFRGGVEENTFETTTGAGGRFRFEELDIDSALEYWLEAVYLDVSYGNAEAYQFDGSQSTLAATITVYETTEDDSGIKLDSVHLIAQSFGQALRVSEIHLFGNSGDRTYVGQVGEGGQAETIEVPMPQNAVGLAFQEGTPEDRFVEVGGGMRDTEPVVPGTETSLVVFSYHLMVTGDTVSLERSFAYPVLNLSALVAQPGLTLSSPQLQSMGAELFQGQQYEFWVGQSLAAGSPLVMELLPMSDAMADPNGLDTPGLGGLGTAGAPTRGNQGLLRSFGFGLAGLAVIGVVAYSLIVQGPRPVPASAPNLMANAKSRRLLADLVGLEDAFEAGEVDEVTYERERAQKYEALKSL